MNVLLSIKPEHAENILSGRKTYEFRRRLFARQDISSILIYCTKPIGRLIGEFEISEILCDCPQRLWKKTKQGSGITKEYFDTYFAGRTTGYALQIGRVRRYNNRVLPNDIFYDFTPPQSFMYVSNANKMNLRTFARSACREL